MRSRAAIVAALAAAACVSAGPARAETASYPGSAMTGREYVNRSLVERRIIAASVLDAIGLALEYFAQLRLVCPVPPLAPHRLAEVDLVASRAFDRIERADALTREGPAALEIILAGFDVGCVLEPVPLP